MTTTTIPSPSRRRLLVRGVQLGGAAIAAMLSIPAIGFLLSPLRGERRLSWVRVGRVDGVPLDTPTAFRVPVPLDQGRPTAPVDRVVYVVRRSGGELLTLSNTCSHMQCNVHWDRGLNQFLCPCHGGLYDVEGRNVGGPPPSPLPRWVHRITTDPDGTQILEIQNRLDEQI